MKEAPMKVTVTGPEVAGSYVVAEQRDDGTLVLRPETTDEVIEQSADRVLSEAEMLNSLEVGDLVEIGGRRYDVVSDKVGGVTLEPATTKTVAEIHAEHGGRPLSSEEFEEL